MEHLGSSELQGEKLWDRLGIWLWNRVWGRLGSRLCNRLWDRLGERIKRLNGTSWWN